MVSKRPLFSKHFLKKLRSHLILQDQTFWTDALFFLKRVSSCKSITLHYNNHPKTLHFLKKSALNSVNSLYNLALQTCHYLIRQEITQTLTIFQKIQNHGDLPVNINDLEDMTKNLQHVDRLPPREEFLPVQTLSRGEKIIFVMKKSLDFLGSSGRLIRFFRISPAIKGRLGKKVLKKILMSKNVTKSIRIMLWRNISELSAFGKYFLYSSLFF